MTRLLPLLAIMVLFLGLVSVVHAQTTTPTVSTVAVTSDPGSDNTYTTLDVITVGVTFSEAVTVTGTPQITLDIGGTERTADYSGAGTATGHLLFSYTVQPVDQDDDGVAVKVIQPGAQRRDHPERGRLHERHAYPLSHGLPQPQAGHRACADQQHGTGRRHGPAHQRWKRRSDSRSITGTAWRSMT